MKILELLTLMENLSVGLQDVYCYEAFSWFSKSVCQLVSQLSMIQPFAVYIWIVVTIWIQSPICSDELPNCDSLV